MNLRESIAAALLAFASMASAQTLATSPKTGTANNPICPYNFCADPTAVEYNGRLYVYGTNDQQEYDIAGSGNNSYGKIQQLVCFSTADLVNWTFHGIIDVKSVCKWIWTSWAPSIVSREEDDGKTHFYMYFTNGASGIGVMTATSPVGPWKDPIGRALIDGSTPGRGEQSNIIDPGVVIDEDGVGWLSFGGGDPNKTGSQLMPGNARIVKLGSNMASLSGSIKKIPAPFHFEANELNKIGEYYVFSYSGRWGSPGDWNSYSGRGTYGAPSSCAILQMRTKTPLDESSWEYTGEVLRNPGNFGYPWGNNHSHAQKFGNSYYMVYHTQWLEQKLGVSGGFRSIAINKMSVSESAGKLGSVTANNTGAPQITANRQSAWELTQAECMAQGAGFKAVAFGKAGNMAIVPTAGSWTMVRNMTFDGQTPKSIAFNYLKGTGTIEIRIGKLTNPAVATIPFQHTGYKTLQADIEQTSNLASLTSKPTDVYVVFTEAKNVQYDSWQFSTQTIEEAAAIAPVEADAGDDAAPSAIYSISGQRLSTPQRGLNIIDGKKVLITQ